MLVNQEAIIATLYLSFEHHFLSIATVIFIFMIKQKDSFMNRFNSEKWFLTITASLRSSNQACYVFQSSLTPLDNGEAN
jgi:type IV secretory pathway component VirB8